MEHLDAIRLCLFGIIALVPILWLVPTKCQHECHQCRIERLDKARQDAERFHNLYHSTPHEGCPYCKGQR